RMALFAGGTEVNHGFSAEDAELVAPLRAEPHEKGGHAVVILLAPLLEGVMVAFGALHAHSQEELGSGFGPVGGIVRRAVKIGRAFGISAPFRRDDVADKLIDRP